MSKPDNLDRFMIQMSRPSRAAPEVAPARHVGSGHGIRMHRLYTPATMRAEWFRYLVAYHEEFAVPTNVVLRSWEPRRPRAGRVFWTDLIARGTRVWTSERYAQHLRSLGTDESVRLLPGDEHVRLAECWFDEGSDSEVYYQLGGWMFVGQLHLAAVEASVRADHPHAAVTHHAIGRIERQGRVLGCEAGTDDTGC